MNSFIKNFKGQIVATLGGIVIAIFTVLFSTYFNNNQIEKQDRILYQAKLYTLSVELYWQNEQFKRLQETLNEIELTSKAVPDFVISSSLMQFDLSIIEKSITDISDYDESDQRLAALLTSYKNLLKEINFYIDFSTLNSMLADNTIQSEGKSLIPSYIHVLNTEYIEKTQPKIELIQDLISHELEDYPKDKMILNVLTN